MFPQDVFDFTSTLTGQTLKLTKAAFGAILHLPKEQITLLLIQTNQATEESITSIQQQHLALGRKVICLWEDVWMSQSEKVKSRLTALCGKARKIHARQTEVKRLDTVTAKTFLDKHHLQQYATAYYKYGLYQNEQLMAVATFSNSRVMHDGPVPYRSYELVRFACTQGTIINGGLSKLLRHFITQHHPAHLMTYIDLDWGDGKSFEKFGFTVESILPAFVFYVKPGEWKRIPLHKFDDRQSPFCKKVWNSGNKKMVLDLRK
ncbi:MAG: hypothetical protein WC150_12830 [Bacteroidia bacterium]